MSFIIFIDLFNLERLFDIYCILYYNFC